MKKYIKILFFVSSILIIMQCKKSNGIPIVKLKTTLETNKDHFITTILKNEIKGIKVEHVVLKSKKDLVENFKDDSKTIFLFINGEGSVVTKDSTYEIVPETILLPQALKNMTVKTAENNMLHYLRITSKLTAQDLLDLKEFPAENVNNVYYAKFIDCKSYTEPIKSPNTVSRTIMPNKYIPRIAMGTVQTKGPDKVGAHEHPMLEQLFLGLTDNNSIVYADDDQVDFPEYSVLHIPLGSSHSVSVDKDEEMYYVWMDFFRDKKGEEWLKTHNQDD